MKFLKEFASVNDVIGTSASTPFIYIVEDGSPIFASSEKYGDVVKFVSDGNGYFKPYLDEIPDFLVIKQTMDIENDKITFEKLDFLLPLEYDMSVPYVSYLIFVNGEHLALTTEDADGKHIYEDITIGDSYEYNPDTSSEIATQNISEFEASLNNNGFSIEMKNVTENEISKYKVLIEFDDCSESSAEDKTVKVTKLEILK